LVCNGSTKPCPPGAPVFSTVQGAVNAANPGDWVLIWPGVYHEKSTKWPTAGGWIQKPGLRVRGLDRDGGILDGSTRTAAPARRSAPRPPLWATRGAAALAASVAGRAGGAPVQTLPVCDYLAGTDGQGNEIWGTGGDGSGKIGMGSSRGSSLTPPSMYGPPNL